MAGIFDKFRMLIWLVIGLALYAVSFLVFGTAQPTFQTIAYKLGHVTTLAWIGYWISRMALGRIEPKHHNRMFIPPASPSDRLARAVVIAGVIIAGSLGL